MSEPRKEIFWDPVRHGWCFWDETWGNSYGPYETYKIAEGCLDLYIKHLNGTKEEIS